MNIALWIIQGLLAAHTVMGAIWKFTNSEQNAGALKALPHTVWQALSVFELVCAVALIVPAFLGRPLTLLVPFAALGIAAEMLLFSGVHLSAGGTENGQLIYWLVVAAVCAFVAYGRFSLKPF